MIRRKPDATTSSESTPVWRSLEEKELSPEERARLAEEEVPGGFVQNLLEPSSLTRRNLLKGSSIAALAASLQGCLRRPESYIYPYSDAPENLIPGIPSHFATVTARGRDALGVVVTSHDGRPTKVEGNPRFPTSLGATDVRAQEYVWDLYDPDRSKSPAQRNGNALVDASSEQLEKFLDGVAKKHTADEGAGLRILAPISNSPSFRRMRGKVLAKFPKATFHTYSPINDDNAREGSRMSLDGQATPPIYDYSKSMVTVSLGSDFLGHEAGSVASARRFAATRTPTGADAEMGRLYVLESNFTVTGSLADHRLRCPQSDIEWYARMLAFALAARGVAGMQAIAKSLNEVDSKVDRTGLDLKWLAAVANDLVANRGRSVVVAGSGQPPRVHALVNAINASLDNFGRTTFFGPDLDREDPASRQSIANLAADADSTSTLIILGGNPVYDAPADLKFADLLKREGLTSLHLSSHRNETTELCSWHAPLAHELEAWGDQQALGGSLAVQQPLIAPLYGGRSEIELLATLAGEETTKGHDIVRETQSGQIEKDTDALIEMGISKKDLNADTLWRRGLHSGLLLTPQATKPPVMLDPIIAALAAHAERVIPTADSLEVSFEPDNALWDGQHANNLWALELPRPMTKLVWDNAALMSPSTRDALGLRNGQMVRLANGDAQVEVPVWPLPGHADHCITLSLGWGRTAAGRYGNGKGFDVYPLRTSDAMDFVTGVKLEPLSSSYNLVQTQTHDSMEGRPLAIDATLSEYRKNPKFASYSSVDPVSTPPLWEQPVYDGHKWGMTIDLASCSGCNACVVACQAENTIPVVGKVEVERGREMHWLRIDRYFVGEDSDDPRAAVQPVACQQCELAPCENVCPVNATVHSDEGLNDMVYNRCVGTRYCANNCPYKVRRFNYLEWHSHLDDKFAWYGDMPESRKLQFNPNVTVRMRGVMEKCTYCVQRIQEVKIEAKREGRRPIRDGEIKTACQQACPSGAIVFGDLNNPDAQVTKLSEGARGYHLLAEIGTRPRTTFLARIRNPNPEIEGKG